MLIVTAIAVCCRSAATPSSSRCSDSSAASPRRRCSRPARTSRSRSSRTCCCSTSAWLWVAIAAALAAADRAQRHLHGDLRVGLDRQVPHRRRSCRWRSRSSSSSPPPAAASLWMRPPRGRGAADASTSPPSLGAACRCSSRIYVAAVPSYGVQYNVLFTLPAADHRRPLGHRHLPRPGLAAPPRRRHDRAGLRRLARARRTRPRPGRRSWRGSRRSSSSSSALSHFTRDPARRSSRRSSLHLSGARAMLPIPRHRAALLFGALFVLVAVIAAYAIRARAGMRLLRSRRSARSSTEGVWSAR